MKLNGLKLYAVPIAEEKTSFSLHLLSVLGPGIDSLEMKGKVPMVIFTQPLPLVS